MPYIDKDLRNEIKDILVFDIFRDDLFRHPGTLNYILTKFCTHYIKHLTYTNLNEVVGVLESVKQEFYRKMVIPYEAKKELENGDLTW